MRLLIYHVPTGVMGATQVALFSDQAVTGDTIVLPGIGYSGRGDGLNNPTYQEVHDLGPIPAGMYTVEPSINPPTHLGPFAFPLIPSAANQMFGRDGFYIHGDNAQMNHSASDGCIILPHETRLWIAFVLRAEPVQLKVVAF